MNNYLQERLKRLRSILSEEPQRYMLGSIADPYEGEIDNSIQKEKTYISFLKSCNGARFGAAIVFWDYASLLNPAWQISHLPGGHSEWMYVGAMADEPLVMKRGSDELWHFYRDEPHDGELLGTFDEYLEKILSDRYSELSVFVGAERDFWYQALQLAGYVN